ncbi:MAG: hypothetical protein H0T42_03030 [Deltaproteobacteria bacterium]|nr:hypothetical protein [Deltaproteobacteria bacterium]
MSYANLRARTPWAAVAALAGCGSSPSPAPDPAETRHDAQTAPRWLECTESVRAPMEAALLARYHLEKTDQRVDGLRCVTIQLGPQPAFFVELIGSERERHRRLLGAIATDATTELVGLRDARLEFAQLRGGKVWFETIDLDGDRSDEVVVHYDDLRQDAASWIDVIALRGRALTEIAGPRISFDDPDLDDEACHGVLTTQRAGVATQLVVTTTGSTGRSDHCLADGRHVFALDADRLVEIR